METSVAALPLTGIHHLKLPVRDLKRSVAWYERTVGYRRAIEFVEAGQLMSIGMRHPNGGPDLAVRLDPARAEAIAGFDLFSIGVADKATLDALAARLDALGERHAGVHFASIGWILPELHDPDGHEIRFCTMQHHTEFPEPGAVLTVTDVGPAGSALELDGGDTISGTSIDGNLAVSTSASGLADTNGGLAVFYFGNPGGARLVTVRNSDISGNVTESFSKTGSAKIEGAAVFNNSLLVMRNDHVSDNVGRAEAPIGVAQGGGIWNGVDASTGASPPAQLTLVNTSVTHNLLEGREGVTLGGGIFTASPATLTLTNTQIAFNRPDQCFGC